MSYSKKIKKGARPPYKTLIKKAMDGRTQRWLSTKTGIAEVDLSNRINGKVAFTQEQLDKINLALDLKLKLEAL